MPVDITLGHLTAGGLFELQAAWTKAGENHIRGVLAGFLSNQDVELVTYVPPDEAVRRHYHDQSGKLYLIVYTAPSLC